VESQSTPANQSDTAANAVDTEQEAPWLWAVAAAAGVATVSLIRWRRRRRPAGRYADRV
jgi:bacteriorhodopsin